MEKETTKEEEEVGVSNKWDTSQRIKGLKTMMKEIMREEKTITKENKRLTMTMGENSSNTKRRRHTTTQSQTLSNQILFLKYKPN